MWKPLTVGELSDFFDGLPSNTPVRIYLEGAELDVSWLDTTRRAEYELLLERRLDVG